MTDEELAIERRNADEAIALCGEFEQHLNRLDRLRVVDQRRALMLIEQLDKTFAAWRSNFS